MDRARYGAYPPGSTFKLLVALAALRDGRDGNRFTCARLPDGRIGTRISGWTRPVRDDVLDTHPHGTIGMHDGLVHSCNAYFAQLAVKCRAGSARLTGGPVEDPADADRRFPRARPRCAAADRLRAGTRSSRLRCGWRRLQARWPPTACFERHTSRSRRERARRSTSIVDPAAARRLASYMRDVVVDGTARSLNSHPVPIAGKTGTAEVSGRDSHGWFVGFAPYGQAPAGAREADRIRNRDRACGLRGDHGGAGGWGNRQRRSLRGPDREVSDMDFLRKAKDIEAKLAGTLDRTDRRTGRIPGAPATRDRSRDR